MALYWWFFLQVFFFIKWSIYTLKVDQFFANNGHQTSAILTNKFKKILPVYDRVFLTFWKSKYPRKGISFFHISKKERDKKWGKMADILKYFWSINWAKKVEFCLKYSTKLSLQIIKNKADSIVVNFFWNYLSKSPLYDGHFL